MMKEEAIKLLNNDRWQDAYSLFEKINAENPNLEIEYYLTMINFHYIHSKSIMEYYQAFKRLLSLPPKFHESLYFVLITVCIDLHKYDDVYKYCQKIYHLKKENYFVDIAYAKALLEYKHDFSNAIAYVDYALNKDSIEEQLLMFAYEVKVLALLHLKENSKVNSLINKMYFTFNNKTLILLLELKVACFLNYDKKEVESIYSKIKNTDAYNEASQILIRYYHNNKNFTEAIALIENILENVNPNDDKQYELFYDLKVHQAMYFNTLKHVDKAIEIFDYLLTYKKHTNEIYYYLGEFYYKKHTRKDIVIAKNYYLLASKEMNIIVYNCLGDCYYHLNDLENMADIIEKAKMFSRATKNMYYHYLSYQSYRQKGQYNLALKHLKIAYKTNSIHTSKFEREFVKVNRQKKAPLTIEDSVVYYREAANGIWHGIYNINGKDKDAVAYAKKAYEIDQFPYTMSMYGTVILNENPEKAFQLFEEGANRYFQGDLDDSCVGHYLYCLIMGIGVEKNNEKAKGLMAEAISLKGLKSSENVVNLYALLAISDQKLTRKAYEFLLNYHSRRNNIAKWYYLMKLAEQLGISVDFFAMKYRKAIKGGLSAERKHYNNDPLIPYMNNF